MAFLMYAALKQDLIHQQYQLTAKLTQITRKMFNLNKYATNISDGSISMNDMMNTPASLFGRQNMFMSYSHNMALAGAQQQMAQMAPMMQAQLAQMPPQYQQAYQNMIFQNLYKQQRDQIKDQETQLLNEQEEQITAEKEQIQSQLAMIKQELDSVRKAEAEGIKDFTPNYTGQG